MGRWHWLAHSCTASLSLRIQHLAPGQGFIVLVAWHCGCGSSIYWCVIIVVGLIQFHTKEHLLLSHPATRVRVGVRRVMIEMQSPDTTVRPCRKVMSFVQDIESTISACTWCQKKLGHRAPAWRLMYSTSNTEASNTVNQSTYVVQVALAALYFTPGYTSIACLSLHPLYSPAEVRRTGRTIEQAINNIDVRMVHTSVVPQSQFDPVIAIVISKSS